MGQVVIGTAGHIDHGKTALVEALTGTNTDKLEEECRRGMTIELGFAYLNEDITIIDVPGHERFIRNMVAGVSTIHVALLVVAADDGIMPQTREHLQVLLRLGNPSGVIALTKVDRVNDPDWLDLVEADVSDLVKGTNLETAPIIRTSVPEKTGIEELRNALLKAASNVVEAEDRNFFRLPVDRVFSKKGFGAVVTGTVLSGTLKKGAELEVLPGGQKARVRGIQTHMAVADSVKMGDRAALNLSGAEVGNLWRGCELVEPGWLKPTEKIIAHIQLLEETSWKLKNDQRVRVHSGTAEILGRIRLYGRKVIKAAESANILINLEKPMSSAMEDKFILRSYSPMETIAGGMVLDPQPAAKGRALAEWTQSLSGDRQERFNQFVAQNWNNPGSVIGYSKMFGLPQKTIEKIIESLKLKADNGLIYEKEKLEEGKKTVEDFLQKFHAQNPYRKSISGDNIQESIQFSPGWAKIVLNALLAEGKLLEISSGYALKFHQVVLNERDRESADKLSNWIKARGFKVPNLKQSVDGIKIERKKIIELMFILKDEEKVTEIGDDHWIHTEVMEKLKMVIRDYFKSNQAMKVSDFKVLTGTTRKSAIPLLEFCDRNGWTERVGDERVFGEMTG